MEYIIEYKDENMNSTEENIYEMYFDGCSKGNPGLSGAGCVIYKNGEEIWSNSYFVDENATNNVAEYYGLIKGLEKAIEMKIISLVVKGDSQLIIRQMQGEYQVKTKSMIKLHNDAKELEIKFKNITYEHIYRKYNKRADQLSNGGLSKIKNV